MSASNILSLLILASPFALAKIEIDGKEYRDKVFLFLTVAFGLNILRYLFNTLTLKQFYKGAYLRLASNKKKGLPSFNDSSGDGYIATTLKTFFLLPGIVGEQLFLPPNRLLFMFGLFLIPFLIGLSIYYNYDLNGKEKSSGVGAGIGVGIGIFIFVLLLRKGLGNKILVS